MSTNASEKVARRGEFSARVVEQRKFGVGHKSIFLEMTGQAAETFAQAKAGQFIQLACRNLSDHRSLMPLLRRPFSIAGIYPEKAGGQSKLILELIYRVVGPGTQWLERRSAGDMLDILGPLGNGFRLPDDGPQRNILVGGGVGLPPMFFLADQLTQAGFKENVAFAGAKTKSHLEGTFETSVKSTAEPLVPEMRLQQFNRTGTGCIIATDDGSMGYHGTVIKALVEFLEAHCEWQEGRIYACGPDGMLKAIAQFAQEREMDCQVCLEAYMACGIGVCQSCVVPVKASENSSTAQKQRQYKLVCTNGPVFDAGSIEWE